MREVLMGITFLVFLLIPVCVAILRAYNMGYKDGIKYTAKLRWPE